MAERCAWTVLFILVSLIVVNCKVFTRCQLTRELLKTHFHQKTFYSNWVCLIEQESDRNTSAHVVKSQRKQYYGMFQIGSEWCKEGRKGGKCDVACESLLDDDINDDLACALKIFEDEGFKYWNKWTTRCKGERLPDIEKCPDWQHPPRASPERMKRTPKRNRRSIKQSSRSNRIIALLLGRV